jgi:hypothetical protein
MGFGGPVWHASVAGSIVPAVLEREALRQLAGLGDAAQGEWREMGDTAFHVRRRLSAREAPAVGDVMDVRRTPDALRRAAALGARLLLAPPEVLGEELGT